MNLSWAWEYLHEEYGGQLYQQSGPTSIQHSMYVVLPGYQN